MFFLTHPALIGNNINRNVTEMSFMQAGWVKNLLNSM